MTAEKTLAEEVLGAIKHGTACLFCGAEKARGTDYCDACKDSEREEMTRASITNGQPTVSRIPPEALAAVERVLAFRAAAVAEVPGQERWRGTTVKHQAYKAESHALEALMGNEADRDTGEHPLAHSAARALLGLALALQKKEKP